MNEELKRGQVRYIRYDGGFGHEEAVGRPGIIVSSDEGIETSPVVTVVWTTTKVRNIGVAVELNSTTQKSWALCSNVTTVDKRKISNVMCTLTDTEMAKVDLAIRKALGLPVKMEGVAVDVVEELNKNIVELETALELVKNRAAELETDVQVYRRLYDRLLETYIDLKFDRDTNVQPSECIPVVEPVIPSVEEPPVIEEEPEMDLSALQAKFNVYDERLKKKKVEKKVENKVDGRTALRGQPRIGDWISGEKVNVNTCTVDDLVEKAGIGKITSQAIVAYRKKNGAFKDLTDLCNVKRFGAWCFDKYIDRLEV